MNTFAKKYGKNLIAFTLAFCMLCGFLLFPQVYKASDYYEYTYEDKDYSVYYSYYYNDSSGTNLVSLDYVNQTVSLSTAYTRFRLIVRIPHISANKRVNVRINMGFSGGDIYGSSLQLLNSSYANVSGTKTTSVTGNRYLSCNDLELSGDAYFLLYDFELKNRTSTSLMAYPVSIQFWMDEIDITEETLQSIDGTNKNIFTTIGNLPTNIKNALSTLFSSVVSAVGDVKTSVGNLPSNIASSLSTFFGNIPAYVETGNLALKSAFNSGMDALKSSLPSGIKNALSPLFEGVRTAVNGVYDGVGNVVTAVTNLPSNIGGFFTNLGSTIGGFFSPLTDSVVDIYDSLFSKNNVDDDVVDAITGADASVDNINGVVGDITIEKENLSNGVPDVEVFNNLEGADMVGKCMTLVVGTPIISEILFFAFSFAVLGLVLYGKR